MAEDRKFKFENGRFINRVSGEAIPDDEPVIIFRARDHHAVAVLQHYYSLVNDPHHEQAIWERLNEFLEFKQRFPDRMKEPGITHHIELRGDRREPVHICIPENREDAHEMSHDENLHRGRRHESPIEERVEALEHREDSIERKMKKAMADIDTLTTIIQGIADDAAKLGPDFKNLEAELQAAQEAAANNQPIDLTNAILLARSAQEALDGIVQAAEPATTQPPAGGTEQPPVEEPPVEEPPVEQPPVEEPPVEQPPAGDTTEQPEA
jgi:hypothetical protein